LQTLLTLREEDFVLKQIGSEYSHVKNARKSATATESHFEIIKLGKVPLDSTSRILLRLMEQECAERKLEWAFTQLRYNSEADVATLVNEVLLDAIAILKLLGIECGIIGDLAVFQERSLFSGRPDILAVRASTHQLPLLVVEVKKPVKIGDLCDQEKALGQAFDYGEILSACGHPLPLVVLTSLEDSCVCWNSDYTQATELYESGVNTTNDPPPTPQPKTEKESVTFTSASPPMIDTPEGLHSVSHDEGEREFLFEPATQRKLNRSKQFKAHELVHVLCTALVHAAQATPTRPKQIYRLVPGSTYTFPRVLRFTTAAKEYTWGSLTVCVGKSIKSRAHVSKRKNSRRAKNCNPVDGSDDSAYYLIGRLGHGATSNVWHALDSKGNEVVIKMYVRTTTADGTELNSQDFEEEAKSATEKEVENFKKIYKFLKKKVYHMKLCDFNCVVMPFFKPVPKLERKDALKGVEEVLRKDFTPMELKYNTDDVRWSHVGTYNHGKTIRYILYDLADLVSTDSEEFVQAHLDILEDRMGDQESSSEEFECQEVSDQNEEAPSKSPSKREVSL
jgi:hypothetical protein